MFGFGPATRIYVATGATDMRKGFNGLYGLVRDHLGCDPESGHVFLFTNARRNRLKLLVYDHSGLWICSKKLDGGRFRWPGADTSVTKIVLSHEELALLLGGIALSEARRNIQVREEHSRLRRIAKYGPGSEKLSDLQLQLLEEETGVSGQEVAAEREREPLPAAGDDEEKRKRRPHPGRQTLPADLPRVEKGIACTPEQCVCGNCGKQTVVIG